MSMQLKKNCQYCSKKIAYTACYCRKCGKEQINPNLAVEEYFKVQLARYGVILTSLAVVGLSLMVSFGLWEFTVAGLYLIGLLSLLFMILWIPTLLILQFVPEIALSYKIPYLKQRIVKSRKAMWRNVVMYFGIAAMLIVLQYKLSQHAPSIEQFQALLQETAYTEKDLVFQVNFPIGSVYALEKGEEKAVYFGVLGQFIPVNPVFLSHNEALLAEHFNIVLP